MSKASLAFKMVESLKVLFEEASFSISPEFSYYDDEDPENIGADLIEGLADELGTNFVDEDPALIFKKNPLKAFFVVVGDVAIEPEADKMGSLEILLAISEGKPHKSFESIDSIDEETDYFIDTVIIDIGAVVAENAEGDGPVVLEPDFDFEAIIDTFDAALASSEHPLLKKENLSSVEDILKWLDM